MYPLWLAEVTESRTAAQAISQATASHRFALELNPASIFGLYRAGLTLEFSVSRRLAFNFTPSYEFGLQGGAFGEAGARAYTGNISGGFVGLALLGGEFSHRCSSATGKHQGSVYGLGSDIGYQWITVHGVVISIGAGVQLQRSSTDCKVEGTELEQPIVVPSVSKSGILPRLQFAVGYSWST